MLSRIEDNHFEDVKLSGSDISFTSSKVKLCDDLQASLERRFEDVDEEVLEATDMASFRTWPDKNENEGSSCLIA